jgi:putative intracellular protease/amidase
VLAPPRSYPFHEIIFCAGAPYEDAEVVVDRNLVTSRKLDDLPGFDCRAHRRAVSPDAS